MLHLLHLLHLLQGVLPPSEGAVEGGGETSGCVCINFWLFLWKSPVVLSDCFHEMECFFFEIWGELSVLGENWFLGGFINMHSFCISIWK